LTRLSTTRVPLASIDKICLTVRRITLPDVVLAWTYVMMTRSRPAHVAFELVSTAGLEDILTTCGVDVTAGRFAIT
jgi:hypothetical protein